MIDVQRATAVVQDAPLACGAFEYDTREVDTPALDPAEARYALERLWSIAGAGAAYNGRARIRFRALSAAAFATRSIETVPLSALLPPTSALPFSGNALPVFAAAGIDAVIEAGAGWVTFNVDIAAFSFFMLARIEELADGARDQRDRFTAEQSIAARHDFLDRPVVDQWALVLRSWLAHLDPTWRAPAPVFRVFITHDIDVVRRYSGWRDVATAAGSALVRRRSAGQAIRRFGEGLRALRSWRNDPNYLGVVRLMNAAEAHGLRDAFFFKTSVAGPYDSGYDLTQTPGREILNEVAERGHEIGFHPGYDTYCNRALLIEEKRRLEAASPSPILGGRQHNLRFRVPDTWTDWEAAGLKYDSTLGYAERAGFRCGTCHPFPVFDSRSQRQLALIEVPLIAMDTTLFSPRYEGLSSDAAVARIATLADRCREVGGVFTFLWHNSSFEGSYEKWSRIYEPVIAQLARDSAPQWRMTQS